MKKSTKIDSKPKAFIGKCPVFCEHSKLVPVESLKPNPRNPNRHGEEQLRLLSKNIQHMGWRHPISVSVNSGHIVSGHARLESAKRLGLKLVPVDYQFFSSTAEELAVLLADNRIAELAELDNAALKSLAADLEGELGLKDCELTGFTEEEWMRLATTGDIPDNLDADAPPPQKKALSKLGDLWTLLHDEREHRVLCGDSTEKENVARVLGTDKPLLMVTDPPYGVSYNADWRNHAPRKNGSPIGGRAIGKVQNDDRSDWTQAYALFEGDVAYVWHPPGATSVEFFTALQATGLEVRMQCIWAKSHFPIGRGAYHVQHEPCWFAVRKGSTANWIGDRKQTTLWSIPKPGKSETGHSTQKPVECMARPIRNHSSDFVYDPFLGSGTTAIACEHLHRRCLGLEIDPSYVDVIVKRFLTAYPNSRAALGGKVVCLEDFPSE